MEERSQLAVFIDFDNIEIGVKTTLNTELDISLVLDALKERGEIVSKMAYGDWARAGTHSRTLTDHAVHMVQRNVTPRGDKNGADINLVVDALEMAFTRPHINGFVVVGGDSDFIALVEKLKQFGKRVFVVGGRSFTSGILQRNCHEFISYENLLNASRRSAQGQGRSGGTGRLPLSQGLSKLQRAYKILADRGVEPQLGPLKSTLLQLDSTFSERDYGVSSFRDFIQRLSDAGHLHMRRIDQGYLVEMNGDAARDAGDGAIVASGSARQGDGGRDRDSGRHEAVAESDGAVDAVAEAPAEPVEAVVNRSQEDALPLLRAALESLAQARPGKPLYVRHLAQGLRGVDAGFDERTYGFRSLTELVFLGQREGLLRMQRDRQGAWRVSPMTGAAGEGGEVASDESAREAIPARGEVALHSDADGGHSEDSFPATEAVVDLDTEHDAEDGVGHVLVDDDASRDESAEAESAGERRKPAARKRAPRAAAAGKATAARKPRASKSATAAADGPKPRAKRKAAAKSDD